MTPWPLLPCQGLRVRPLLGLSTTPGEILLCLPLAAVVVSFMLCFARILPGDVIEWMDPLRPRNH